MNETKGRIWNEKYKKFCYWGFLKDGAFTGIPTGGGLTIEECKEKSQLFIGRKDSKGIEMYEGDIINCDMTFENKSLPHRGEIVYMEQFGAFATKNHSGETLLHNHMLNTFEVVGNIHENPELLK